MAGMVMRPATRTDAPGMSAMLEDLIAAGKRTARGDPDFVRDSYIDHPGILRCTVAAEDGAILGLQVLMRAEEGNRFDAPVGWGIIGTHVSPRAGRRGIGSRLFAETAAAAEGAGLGEIEAYINYRNVEGQAYCEAMGFRTYRVHGEAVCKRYRVGDRPG